MMKRFKCWLVEQFLPVWAKEELQKEMERLRERNRQLEVLIRQKDAYIEGLEAGIRSQRRIIINAGEVKK